MAIFPLMDKIKHADFIHLPLRDHVERIECWPFIRSFVRLPNVSSQLYTFSCALKNCRLVLCLMFKTISKDRHVAHTRPPLCSISRPSSLNRPQYVCYGKRLKNMATKLRTDRSCEMLSVDYNKRKIGFILQKQGKR